MSHNNNYSGTPRLYSLWNIIHRCVHGNINATTVAESLKTHIALHPGTTGLHFQFASHANTIGRPLLRDAESATQITLLIRWPDVTDNFMHTVNLPCCICWASSVPTLPQFDANALAKSSGQLPLQKLPTIPPCALTKKAPLVMITYNNLNIHAHELTAADVYAWEQSLATSSGKLQLVGILLLPFMLLLPPLPALVELLLPPLPPFMLLPPPFVFPLSPLREKGAVHGSVAGQLVNLDVTRVA